jgi:hypothetical protein
MTSQDLPTPIPPKKPWYKKWWVWLIAGIIVVFIVAAATADPADDEAVDAASTTAVAGETTTSEGAETTTSEGVETTTTAEPDTTTTQPPTTTSTLPPILAEGSGTGDSVVELDIPNTPVIITLTHSGSRNYAVWSLGTDFENIDLLVNEIGVYEGTRPMQFDEESVSSLEITADGSWTYLVQPLNEAEDVACEFSGQGDDVVIVRDFTDSAGPATLVNTGDSNFAIWVWGETGRDLIVNDVGPYEGTVVVDSGLFIWDITATGGWTVDC